MRSLLHLAVKLINDQLSAFTTRGPDLRIIGLQSTHGGFIGLFERDRLPLHFWNWRHRRVLQSGDVLSHCITIMFHAEEFEQSILWWYIPSWLLDAGA